MRAPVANGVEGVSEAEHADGPAVDVIDHFRSPSGKSSSLETMTFTSERLLVAGCPRPSVFRCCSSRGEALVARNQGPERR